MVKFKQQKPADITKTGLQNWRQLQQQNAMNQAGVSDDYNNWRNQAFAFRGNSLYNAREAAPQVVQSPLYNTNTKLGESIFDEDVYSSEQFQNAADVRAENQPWYAQLGAGIGKMAGQAATAFIDGTLGLVLGAGKGITGAIRGDSAVDNWSKLFHNEISDAMYQANQAMEELMPNYKTSQEQNNEWYQNLGTMNFWADGLLKNMGFTIAALYSGQAWNLGLKAAGLLKNASTLGAKIAGSFISAVNEGRVEANQNSTDKLNYDLAQINDTYAKRNQELLANFEDRKQRILNSDMSNNQKNANLLLLQEQQNREKLALDNTYNKLKQGAKDRANAAGIMDLALNIPILAINDFKTFGRVYANGFRAARQEAKNKGLGSLLGQTRRSANEAIIREESPLVNRIIRNADGSYSWKKVGVKDNLLNAGKIALREGNEEMAQQFAANISGEYYSPDSPKAYYEAMRNGKSNLDTQDLMSSIIKGFASSYGDKSQWEQFAIGALNGLIGVPTFGRRSNSTENTWLGRNKFIGISGGAIGEARSNNRINQEGQQVVDNMERLRADIQDKKKLMAQSQSFINAMNGYSNTNNRFEFNNHADNDTFNLFTSYLQAGREDDLKGLINQNYENFTDEQLEDIKGICDFVKPEWTDTTGELTEDGKNQMRAKLSERRDKLLNQFDNYKKALSVIKNTSDIPTEHQNEMAWLLWKANRFTERINEILNDKDNKNSVKNVLNGIEAYTTALRNEQSSLTGNETRTNEEGKEINILKENQELLKTWDNIYSILNGLYQGDVKAIATLANKDNEKAFKSLLSEDFYNTIAENYNVGYLNYMETMENLKDSWKLYDAYNTFNEKLKEYTENPSKIDRDHNKIDKEEEKLEESRDKNSTLDKVASSKVSDLVRELSENMDFDAFDEALDDSALAEEAKSKLNEAKSIKDNYDKSLQELNNKLNDGKISQEEYNLAKQLLDNSLNVSESSDELLDFDSEAFNNIDDVEISPDELSQFKAENSTLSPEELQGSFEELRQIKLDKAKNILSEVKTILKEAKKFKESLPSAEEAKEIEDTNIISNDGVEEGKTIQEQQAENNQANLEKNLKTSKAQLQLKDVEALTVSILAAEGINNPTIKEDLKRVITMIDDSIKDGLKNKYLDIKKMYNDISATQSYKNLQEIIPTINNYLNAIYQYRLNNAAEEAKKETKKEAPLQVDNEIPEGEVDFTPTISDNDLEKFIYNPRAVSINNGSIKSFWYPATTQFSRLRSRETIPYYQEKNLTKEQKTRYQAIYEFLLNHNTFENLKLLQKGSKVHFGFSKSLNEKVDDMVILILDENNNVVGDLSTAYDYNFNNIKGLKELYHTANNITIDSTDTNDIVQIPNIETTVNKKMVGRPNFTAKNNRMTINNIFNGKPSLFGIAMQDGEAQLVIESGVTKNTARSDRELATMSPLDAKKGQPYILIETSDKMRKYYPVPFTMAKFDNRTINTKLGKAVQDVLNTIKDIKNNDDIVKVKDALQELLVIPVLHINLKDNILKIDIQRPTDEHIYTIYNGDINNPNLVTNILNNLKGGNTTFQVSRKYINTTYKGQNYNEMIGEIAETNLKQNATETVNDWFTMNPIVEGKETKAVNPKGLDMNPNKEDKNNYYLTDSNTGRVYFINLSSNKVYEQTAKGNIELGDKFNNTKAFIYCIANNFTGIVHTPWGYYNTRTNRFVQKITDESAAIDRMNATLNRLKEDQAKVKRLDNGRPDNTIEGREGHIYQILEDDGQYHEYEGVHNVIGESWQRDKNQTSNTLALQYGQEFDDLMRQSFEGDVDAIQKPDNMSNEVFERFKSRAKSLKEYFDTNGDIPIANGIVVFNKIGDKRIAGELDLLTYNKYTGEFRFYDFKTSKYRFYTDEGKLDTHYTTVWHNRQIRSTQEQYTRQLSAYNDLFTSRYGTPIANMALIPLIINYNDKGITSFNAEPTVNVKYQPSEFMQGIQAGLVNAKPQEETKSETKSEVKVNYNTNNVFIGGEFGTGTINITDGWIGVSEDPRVWSKDKTVPVFSEVKMKDGSIVTIISYRNAEKFGNNRGINGIVINVKGTLTDFAKELIKDNLTATQFKNSKTELTKQVLEILNSVSRAEGLKKAKSKVETKVDNLANQLDDNTLNIFDNIENALDNTQTKSKVETKVEAKPTITAPTGPQNITVKNVLDTIKKATRKNASKKIKTLLEELKENQEILNLINNTPGVKLNAQLAKLEAKVNTSDSLEEKIAKIKSTFEGTIFNREAKEDSKYTKWNQRIEETKVYRMLPQLSREGVVNLVNSIKNMNGNSTIYGQFKNGIITISENASRGTLYHEAFHYVTQSLLSENELSNLYNQAKTKYGNLENIELEENMAEDFREYMQQEEGFTGIFVKTWRKLKNFINVIFNNQNTIDKLFYDISKGNYSNRVSKEDNYSREVRQYHNDKLMYGRLNEEQKNYIQERGISIKDYNNMSNEEKEILFRCM